MTGRLLRRLLGLLAALVPLDLNDIELDDEEDLQ